MFQLFKVLVIPFLLVSLMSAGVITVINIDFFILENNLSEQSLTEFFQQLLLGISVGVFSWSAYNSIASRSLYVLIAGFFGCMFLRELDHYFDMIVHGFWVYPTLLLAGSAIAYSVKHNEHIISSVKEFSQSNAYFNILVGLVIIMIFSRLFGSGSLWKEVMNENYHHTYKTIIQEGLELFGYVFIFIGSFYQYQTMQSKLEFKAKSIPLFSAQQECRL